MSAPGTTSGNKAEPSLEREGGPGLTAVQRRQIAVITLAAIGVFVFFRMLPTGTDLSHMDFRVNAKNSIEFCDPLNPQFIPVIAVASPVAVLLASEAPPEAGRETRFALTLKTAGGKIIGPEDLLVAHTKRLHLLIVDPTLTDYQHVHPEPGRERGRWTFAFTPRGAGNYRVFADFTPAATGRGLYGSAEVEVKGPASDSEKPRQGISTTTAVEMNGYGFRLVPTASPIRAGKPADLKFTLSRTDGAPVPLEPVMGAFAHLVAFDQARSGFAHLHPSETDLQSRPNPTQPELNFKVTIPRAGRYVIWSQVNLGGREVFTPFWFDVAP